MIRDLLVHVDGSAAGRRRVRFAVELAAWTGARLVGLHVTPPPEVPPRFKPSTMAEVEADLAGRLAVDARRAATAFHAETQQRLADAGWVEMAGELVEKICERARYTDLVILGQYEWQGSPENHPLPVAHSVVLGCGRPVLVVPAASKASTLGRVALAWDGSREAVRAVHDALPLLHLATSVQIMTVVEAAGEGTRDSPLLSDHLARHGVEVEGTVRKISAEADHAALRQQIAQGRYDLVVMGGYSHPAWLQFLFGGATRSILLSSPIPIFVSH